MPYESDRSESRIIWVDLPRAVATGKHAARGSRLTVLDSLRGFGILLVVLGHTSRSAGLVSWIFSFHMPLFFIISGMLFHERQFLDSFKKKVARLLTPYLFFGIVTFAYWALIERRFREASGSVTNALANIFLARAGTSNIIRRILYFGSCPVCLSRKCCSLESLPSSNQRERSGMIGLLPRRLPRSAFSQSLPCIPSICRLIGSAFLGLLISCLSPCCSIALATC